MADADAQPPVVAAAELGVDVAQAVVAGMTAALLELELAGFQVELVMRDQDLLGRDLEETRQRRDRLARAVHESHGLEQPDRLTFEIAAPGNAEIAAFRVQVDLEFACDRLQPPETGVVTGILVFRARVAQADQQFEHGSSLAPAGRDQ